MKKIVFTLLALLGIRDIFSSTANLPVENSESTHVQSPSYKYKQFLSEIDFTKLSDDELSEFLAEFSDTNQLEILSSDPGNDCDGDGPIGGGGRPTREKN